MYICHNSSTYVHAYLHSYIRTYILRYVHTRTCTHVCTHTHRGVRTLLVHSKNTTISLFFTAKNGVETGASSPRFDVILVIGKFARLNIVNKFGRNQHTDTMNMPPIWLQFNMFTTSCPSQPTLGK